VQDFIASHLLQIAAYNDNRRAQSVVVSGATGPNASSINGIYDLTSELHLDRVRYCKHGDLGVWIEHFELREGEQTVLLWQFTLAKATYSSLIVTLGRCALEAGPHKWYDSDLTTEVQGIELTFFVDKVSCLCYIIQLSQDDNAFLEYDAFIAHYFCYRLLLKRGLLLKPMLLQKQKLQ
jgi:hypothetical protein